MTILQKLASGLVVSCQPVDDGPMDRPDITAAMALSAEVGGADGLRIEGIENLKAVRPVTQLPIIGIVKRDLDDSDVRITAYLQDVAGLAEFGADVIAYDATTRPRPVATRDLVEAIKDAGCLAMADCASLEDGKKALNEGADILGTTLSGYAYEIAVSNAGPDIELIKQFKNLGGFVMAEGRLVSPQLAGDAIAAGADCVTVGSAVTRVEHITQWFAKSVADNKDG